MTFEALSSGVASDHDGAPHREARIAGSDDQAFSSSKPSGPAGRPLGPDWIVSSSPGSTAAAKD